MRWLEQRHQGFYAVMDVPRSLRAAFGKKRLVKSLKTRDYGLALARRHVVLAEFRAAIEEAKRGHVANPALIEEGLEWRRTLTAIDRGDKAVIGSFRYVGGSPLDDPAPDEPVPTERDKARHLAEHLLHERLDTLRFEEGREEDAATLGNIAYGHATPLKAHVEDWLREGGPRGPVAPRTANLSFSMGSERRSAFQPTELTHFPGVHV